MGYQVPAMVTPPILTRVSPESTLLHSTSNKSCFHFPILDTSTWRSGPLRHTHSTTSSTSFVSHTALYC